MTGQPCKTNSDGKLSKIGNTPKQLFHAWRTFKFDETTDTIDSYVLRMSEVAAMLNYGEIQILENFKNTLLYRLYLISEQCQ